MARALLLRCLIARFILDIRRRFRGDSAFASPEIYEFLEAEGYEFVIRLPSNKRLNREIAHLLTRPVGRPLRKPIGRWVIKCGPGGRCHSIRVIPPAVV